MYMHVTGQPAALGESHGTAGAAVGSFGRVAPQVSCQVAADSEGATTQGARKRLLSSVRAKVAREVHLPVERLRTDGAREGPLARVRPLVIGEVAGIARHVTTVAAHKPMPRPSAGILSFGTWRDKARTAVAIVNFCKNCLQNYTTKSAWRTPW